MPIVNGLEQEFEGQVAVVRLNAAENDNRELQQTYGVQGHPSFVVVDGDGAVAETFFGPQDEETLRAAMAAISP